MNDTWYDMGFDADMSWMYDWKGKEKKTTISELKKKIVIDNYFKKECDVNTSIKEAFTKGFELGLKKAHIPQQEIRRCEKCRHFRKLPYHADALGKCIQHTGFCPKGDWYCADYELQVERRE